MTKENNYKCPIDAEHNRTSGEHDKICTLTLVNGGMPDSVLRISPADHSEEKVWLDRQPGVERWAAIQALMQRYCPRGAYVPKPAFWHPVSSKQEDLSVPILKPEDIPHIHLDGAILSAPPIKETVTRPKTDEATEATKARIAQLEGTVLGLTELVKTAVGALKEKQAEVVSAPQPEKKKPGRPKKQTQPV